MSGKIEFIKPRDGKEIELVMHPLVKEWFFSKFKDFSLTQLYGVMPIHERKNILVSAPTGGTKTLTAFLSILNYLVGLAEKSELEEKVYAVYASPLKALSNDIYKNLIEPLAEIEKLAEKKGMNMQKIRVSLRTGDTTTTERSKMLKNCPHILVSTPETLAILLTTSKFVEKMRGVEFMIVDEIHALANKRGTYLSISLERLQEISKIEPVRIGLSACLEYNQKLWLEDGLIEIGRFVEKNILEKTKFTNELQNVDIRNKNIFISSYDGKKLTNKRILKAWRIPAPKKIAKIKTNYGKEICLTLNDKLLKLTGRGYEWERVDKLKRGDLISAPLIVDSDNNFDLLDILLKERFWEKFRILCDIGEYRTALRRAYHKRTLKEICLECDIDYKTITKPLKSLSLGEFNKICRLTGLDLKEEIRKTKIKGKTIASQAIKIPKLNEDLMWFFGIIASDGYNNGNYISLLNKNKKICKKAEEILKKEFGLRCGYKIERGYHKIQCKSIVLCNILDEIGIKIGKKSRNLEMSLEFLKCKNNLLSSFVGGYIDGDGTIDEHRIALHSSSEKMIDQLRYILFRNGIACSKEKSSHSYTDIYLTRIFRNNDIKFLKEKTIKGEDICLLNNKDIRTDFVPIGRLIESAKTKHFRGFKEFDDFLGGTCSFDIIERGYSTREKAKEIAKMLDKGYSEDSQRIFEICENGITAEKIENIEVVTFNDSFVYDLTIEDSHNFVVEGLIVHNTIAPLEEIARFLVGTKGDCGIAEVEMEKKIDIEVVAPSRMIETSAEDMHDNLYEEIDRLIQEHKTTLIFTNTRAATERVIHHLKDMFPAKYLENIGAHHSSLSKEHRFGIEERLRNGELKVVVTSTSLELGIDIGYVDLVLLLGSPKSTARALQRIGRAGHKLNDTAKGRFLVLDRDDLVECSVILKEARERKIDRVFIPKNCLDVLSQQIFGMAIYKIWDEEEMFNLIRRSYCYSTLTKDDFLAVISYLAGDYALEHRNVYAKIWYDEKTRQIGKRGKLARVMYMTNIGTIPDESFINVVIAGTETTVGKIDEGFLERLKPRDVFVLGGARYEFAYTRGMKAYVRGSVNRPPTIPSWFSEMLPLSFDLAIEISRFRGLLGEKFSKKMSEEEIKEWIKSYLYVSESVAEEIYDYCYSQFKYIGMPSDRKIIIERYSGEKEYVIFHSLFGRRVNDALSRAIAFLAGRLHARDVEIGISDNGFFLSGEKLQIERVIKHLTSKNVEEILKEAIEKTEVLKRRFRHCAARSLMILRNYKGRTRSAGKQQMKSHFLYSAVKRLSNEFPILQEARREVMEDLMDIENTKVILELIESGRIKLEYKDTDLPSPFSLGLIMQGYSDLVKMEDRVEFLKRMHKSVMERIKKEE